MFDVEIAERFCASGIPEYQRWFFNTMYHRVYGPAISQWNRNGTIWREDWYIDGRYHRENGPAVQQWYRGGLRYREEWYSDGTWHRVNGPAEQRWYENGILYYQSHWVYGVEITEKIKEWAIEVGIPDITNMTEYEMTLLKITWDK